MPKHTWDEDKAAVFVPTTRELWMDMDLRRRAYESWYRLQQLRRRLADHASLPRVW